MMKKNIFFLLFILVLIGCARHRTSGILDLVNPFIGTDGHGHTYPGASLPFGMVQLSPDTRKDSWDGCSGYHYSDSTILGFSHTHLSGTGVGDYGDIRFMPQTGVLHFRPGDEGNTQSGYRSAFSHGNESASPGYYQVYLTDYNVNVELTVSDRCGFHRYEFPAAEKAYILIDLKESVVTEQNLDLGVEIINETTIAGWRKSSGWAKNQVVYFYAEFSKPFKEYGIVSGGEIKAGETQASGDDIQAYAGYATGKGEAIMVRVGLSPVSMEGAKQNLETEIGHWRFRKVKREAGARWKEELAKVTIKGGTPGDRVKFYTSLYHAFLAPNLFTDVNGQYRGHDGEIHQADDFTAYTVFSLWDTYRALHPLMTFLQPERTVDFINTMIDIHDKGGLLPVWELAGNETFCMIGYHSVPVIADAYLKGIGGFDAEKAYRACINSAEQDHFGLDHYRKYWYIPAESEGEAISKTLEYAYDDWCIAMMANKMGYTEDYRNYIRRAQNYKNLFDPETAFLRGKRNAMFTRPFDPAEVNFMLTEANTWQYTFYVPHDIDGLMKLLGGTGEMERKLDQMFTDPGSVTGRQQADITGLIGQYAHGNEPSHHAAYLYNYVGKPYKTQKMVRQIMSDLYGAGPDGLCGNEDCGQMSAWFVFSSMGFYPVAPGSGDYILGSPLFEEVRIKLPYGRAFVVRAKDNNTANVYIQSATLNGLPYSRSFLSHEDLMQGGEMMFQMGSRPNADWASLAADRPVSAIMDELIVPVPYFKASSSSFQDTLHVTVHHADPHARIMFRANDEPAFQPYREPYILSRSGTFDAYASDTSGEVSLEARARFHRVHHNWTVAVKFPYSPQYTGGGDMALIDGQRGGANFRTGSWQGYHGHDMEILIDMGSNQSIGKVAASFLQDQRSWIFMPEEVEFQVSRRPFDFRTIAIMRNPIPDNYADPVIHEFTKEGIRESGRYLKVVARNRGTCPPWHAGAGEKAWIFADEIIVE